MTNRLMQSDFGLQGKYPVKMNGVATSLNTRKANAVSIN